MSFVKLPVLVFIDALPKLVHVVKSAFAIVFEVHNVAASELAQK